MEEEEEEEEQHKRHETIGYERGGKKRRTEACYRSLERVWRSGVVCV